MKNKWIKRAFYTFYALLFMTVGSIGTIIVKKVTNLTISNELYLLDIISILITILFGFYIGVIVEKNKSDERIEKDTIINYYKEYGDLIHFKIGEILDDELEYFKISLNLKLVRARLHHLNSIVVSSKILNEDDEGLVAINNEVKNLWSLCTGDSDISSIKTREKIELKVVAIDNLLYKLILKINRM